MRILVLTSRYTATQDIIERDFGRQVRLFSEFRKLGHHIDFYVADYRKFETKNLILHGINVKIRPFSLTNMFRFARELDDQLKTGNFDFLISSSDPLWGVLGYYYSKKNSLRFIYDLHDNYETYASYKIPLIAWIDNHIIKNADLITVVSQSLKRKISKKRNSQIVLLPNGYDGSIFKPLNKKKCRKDLGLEKHDPILVYSGSLQRSQGIKIMIEAFKIVRMQSSSCILAIAGKFYGNEKKHIDLSQEGIVYLGALNQKNISKLINCADVAIVPNLKNDFTNYCFPYKIVEYMACAVPIVATDVGDISYLLDSNKESLCSPSSPSDMAAKIIMQLKLKKGSYNKIMRYKWDSIAKKFERFLKNDKMA
jgi:glycosyltransferase involved in cell wall biosynthesis